AGRPDGWLLVARRRERVVLVDVPQLALVILADELGLLFLPVLVQRDVLGLRRRVGGRRHLVRVVGVEPGRDPLLLGEPGELLVLVVIDVLRRAPVLTAIRWNRSGKSSCSDIAPPGVSGSDLKLPLGVAVLACGTAARDDGPGSLPRHAGGSVCLATTVACRRPGMTADV